MRKSAHRILVLAALSSVVAVAAPGLAAPAGPKPQVTDPVGDANAINGQGIVGSPVPNDVVTPADLSGADIVWALFQTAFTKVGRHEIPVGFTVKLHLAAAPLPNVVYRITVSLPSCSGLRFEYEQLAGTAPTGDVNCFLLPPATSTVYTIPPVTVSGGTITWTVPLKAVAPDLKVGNIMSAIDVSTRALITAPGAPVGVTAPQIDEATTAAVYRIGS